MSYPKFGCKNCGRDRVCEPNSMAIFSGGALLMDPKTGYASMDPNLIGFLSVIWHGAHSGGIGDFKDKHVMLDIARDEKGGQFEFYFCSFNCMKSFICNKIDELEALVSSSPEGGV